MKKLITVAVIVVVAVGGAFLFLDSKTSAPAPSNTQPQNETSNVEPTKASDSTSAAAVITYSNGSFSPANLTVKSGDTVEIKNDSNRPLQFDSDPHPAHTDDVELNIGLIAAGQSKKFTLTNKGTWGYHNHLNSSESGKVTVE